jgi:opacity protein-like surface antigen
MSGPALAADLYVPDQPVEAPPAVQPIASNGWYLRGDLSYDFVNLRGAKYFQGSNRLVNDFDKADVDNTGNLGLGVGYQVNDYFRVDTTFDYMFSSDFRGSTSGTCGVGGPCRSRDTSAFTAYSLMANAYVDAGHYGMFTPYLGVGLGGTHVKWDDLKNTACDANNPDNCDDTVTHKGREGWRFTYALMAGTAIDINCKLKADVGYRFRHVMAGDMFGFREHGGPGSDKGFNIHEARAGIRYSFDDGNCQQAYVPPADMPQQQQPVFK